MSSSLLQKLRPAVFHRKTRREEFQQKAVKEAKVTDCHVEPALDIARNGQSGTLRLLGPRSGEKPALFSLRDTPVLALG
jgi:hypothetical protein